MFFHEQGLDIAFLKSLEQWRINVLPWMSTASNSSNQVAMVVSESSPFSWDSTLSHTSATEFKRKHLSLVKNRHGSTLYYTKDSRKLQHLF